MTTDIVKTTDRLRLRQWTDEDRPFFAALNDDPAVMQYFPRTFTREESDLFIDEHAHRIDQTGWGCWAVEITSSAEFIGYVGFSEPADWHPCAGEIEIGWRLALKHWGLGYATEAAVCALDNGFNSFGFEGLVSFTSECNLPSINVMNKLGMIDDRVGFDHPRIDRDSRLYKHVVYRLDKHRYLSLQ